LNLFLSGFISSLPQLAGKKGYVVVVVVVVVERNANSQGNCTYTTYDHELRYINLRQRNG